jgi:hypothetical protein
MRQTIIPMIGRSGLAPVSDRDPAESVVNAKVLCSIGHAATDHSFKEIIMFTTFSLYAYVSIIISGAFAFAALRTTKDNSNSHVAIHVSDASATPDRLATSSDIAE